MATKRHNESEGEWSFRGAYRRSHQYRRPDESFSCLFVAILRFCQVPGGCALAWGRRKTLSLKVRALRLSPLRLHETQPPLTRFRQSAGVGVASHEHRRPNRRAGSKPDRGYGHDGS